MSNTKIRLKKIAPIIICSVFTFSLHHCTGLQELDIPNDVIATEEDEKEYALVWSDEFNIHGKPNPDNWLYEKGFVRNNEDQWYQEENAFVEDGILIIEGRRDTFPNPGYDSSSNNWREKRENVYYTSSSLNTNGLHSWTYGRFEIKAKIVTEDGLWPAFWTLGSGHEWPQGGEVDIMEYYRGNLLANVAWAGSERWTPIWDSEKLDVGILGENWDDDFHVWRMDWTPSLIEIFVDDRLLNSVKVNTTLNQRGDINNPFQQTKQYILVNLAIGGNNGGDPDKTDFPSRYEVDYVRVFQLQ